MSAKKKNANPVVEAEPVVESPKESPRTIRSREKLTLACELIGNLLADGEWVSSNEIHRALYGQISDGMFGRAKKELGIVHRRVKVNGKGLYEWKLDKPAKKR